jgi:hypothetical protein
MVIAKQRGDLMAYKYKNSKGNEYFLHARVTKLRNGKEQTLYYFAKEQKDGAIDSVPDGYRVTETATGLPVLQRAADFNKQ